MSIPRSTDILSVSDAEQLSPFGSVSITKHIAAQLPCCPLSGRPECHGVTLNSCLESVERPHPREHQCAARMPGELRHEMGLAAAVEGLPVGRIAGAFARRFRTVHVELEVISEDIFADERGECARLCP